MRIRQTVLVSLIAAEGGAAAFQKQLNGPFRGVPPWQLDLYESRYSPSNGEFECLSLNTGGNWKLGNNELKPKLNDNVCDCEDGSDEPGTSACAGLVSERQLFVELEDFEIRFPLVDSSGREWSSSKSGLVDRIKAGKTVPGFFCPQSGHVPKLVPNWRVNDNICDCCDGSDEFPLAHRCPQTCGEESAKRTEWQKRLSAETRALTSLRNKRLDEGVTSWTSWETEVAQGAQQLDDLKRQIKDEEEIQKSTSTTTTSTASEEVEKKRELLAENEVASNCHENDDGFVECPEEGEGEVKKEKISEYAKWMDAEKETSLDSNETERAQTLLLKLHQKLALMFNLAHYSIHQGKNSFERQFTTVRHKLSRQATLAKSHQVQTLQQDKLSILNSQLHQKEAAIARATENLGISFLKEHREFVSWVGQSFSYTIGEKRTELTLDEIKMSEGWYGKKQNLGKLSKVVTTSPSQDKVRPSRFQPALGHLGLLFDGGDECGSGRSRSTTVWLVCAKEETLVLVEEPEPCRHVGVLTTPIACVEDATQFDAASAPERISAPRRKRMGGEGPLHSRGENDEL